jgi:hypothetical protein
VQSGGPNNGDQIDGKALVTETGEVFFAGINMVNGCAAVGFGQIAVDGSAVSGSTTDGVVTFSANPGVNTSCSYSDGSTSATSALSGTVTERSSLSLTVTSTTTSGTSLGAETHTWSYSNLYAEMPSLATIAGNYGDGPNTLTLGADGSVFEQDPGTGCVIGGQVAIINPAYNAYSLSFTFSNCTGNAAILNGQTASGLGYYDDSVNPIQFLWGIHGTISGQTFVLAGELLKM